MNNIIISKVSKTEVCAGCRKPVVFETTEIEPRRNGEPDYRAAALHMAVAEYEHYAVTGNGRNWAWQVTLNGEDVDRDLLGTAEQGIEPCDIYDALVARGMSEEDAERALA